jgi:hypothetical protein
LNQHKATLRGQLVRMGLGYPSAEVELAMLYARQREDPLGEVAPVASAEALPAMQAAVREVEVNRGRGLGGGPARSYGGSW